MNLKIIITGPGASGKDTLRRRLEKTGMTYGRPYTTRPMRVGESDSDYTFVSEDDFDFILEHGGFGVSNTYNNWKYGILNDDLKSCDLFVMTPEYISMLGERKKEFFIILLCPDEETRRRRLTERCDADVVERRLNADRKQFEGFTGYDLMITNEDF
jgi:guanylate kinase